MGTWRNAKPGTMLHRLARRISEPMGPTFAPEDVARACDEFMELWPQSEQGPAHIVLSDYNFESHWIGSCIGSCLADLRFGPNDERADTIDFLAALLSIGEEQRVFPHEDEYV